MVVSVNSKAMLGEHERDVVRTCGGFGGLTNPLSESTITACHCAATTTGAGPIVRAAPPITLRRAVQIAARALREHEDRTGQPRILHALSVMNACSTEDERIVAVLYPVVESGQYSIEALGCEGLPEHLANALDVLTRKPGETESQSSAWKACQPIAQAVLRSNVHVSLTADQARHDGSAQWAGPTHPDLYCRPSTVS